MGRLEQIHRLSVVISALGSLRQVRVDALCQDPYL